MNSTFRLLLVATAALMFAAPCAMAQTSAAAGPPSVAMPEPVTFPVIPGVQVERAAFGVISDLGSPEATLKPMRVVMRDGQPVGWVIALQTQKPDVRWREEFSLPVAPKTWGLKSDSTDVRPPMISADRRSVTTERRSVPAGGTIHHWWKLDNTDPTGPHTMRVYVEDVLVATFEFEIQ